jgi:hypothetical protein
MKLPDCIRRFRRPLRGQLQRFVMITIRVMAWRERAYFCAHAIRATPEKRFAVSSSEPTDTSATRYHPDLRASNSGGPYPRHHICSQIQHLLRTIRVMARPERACHPAHAARATPEKRLAVSSSEPTAASAIRNPPDLRASNSGELPPCHHLRTHTVADLFFFLITRCALPKVSDIAT